MRYGIDSANTNGRTVEYRTLGEGWEEQELKIAQKHSHARLWGFNS
jgi:hypothetical protein